MLFHEVAIHHSFSSQSTHTHARLDCCSSVHKNKNKSISAACNTEIGHLKQCKQGFCKQKGDAVSEIADQE